MKITNVKSFVSESGHFFVKVETDAGIYGVGEGGLRRAFPRLSRSDSLI